MDAVNQEIQSKTKDLENKIEAAKKMQEGRLSLSIETLKGEISDSIQMSQENISEVIERVQHDVENVEPRFQQIYGDIGALSDQNQNTAQDLLAQFEERNAQVDKLIDNKLKEVEGKIQ